ncbi:cation/calcium exchanger [Trifolium repens]|nr:cation/calcium exchanger [Trifolium repens]
MELQFLIFVLWTAFNCAKYSTTCALVCWKNFSFCVDDLSIPLPFCNSAAVYDQLQAEIVKTQSETEAFVKVFGKEHGGSVRSRGLGVTPSQLTTSHSTTWTSSSEANEKMKKMQDEIDSLQEKASQVDILKEQVPLLMQKSRENRVIEASRDGLTVLAWGNSLGDLIANGAMAKNGGVDGAQIAVSGCYAGPMFNILMGLGLPLVLSAWGEYPNSYVVPKDSSLLGTILFLMVGVLWSLVVLVKKNMRLDKFLGAGLLTIYLCFLFLRLAMAIGVLH